METDLIAIITTSLKYTTAKYKHQQF